MIKFAVIQDFNKDGHLDILGIGAIHQAEIETIRYDGNRGYLLLGDGKGNFSSVLNSGINLRTNARSIGTHCRDDYERRSKRWPSDGTFGEERSIKEHVSHPYE